jgi:hypothetical protein
MAMKPMPCFAPIIHSIYFDLLLPGNGLSPQALKRSLLIAATTISGDRTMPSKRPIGLSGRGSRSPIEDALSQCHAKRATCSAQD